MSQTLVVRPLLAAVVFIALHAAIAVADTPYQTLFTPTSRVSCYRIPSLVTAPNGDLLAVADQRVPNCNDLNRNNNIELAMRRSTDHGKSWEPIQTIVQFPKGASASDPSMVVDTTTNTVFLLYNFMNHSSATSPNQYFFHVMQSQDNGHTWSAPRDITSQIIPPRMAKQFIFVTSGRAYYDPVTQQIVHNVINVNMHSVIPFGSSDHGKTWWYRNVTLSPADESKSVILHEGNSSGNGTWIINSRTREQHRVWYVSEDNGYTWKSQPMPDLYDPGCNAGFITYRPSQYELSHQIKHKYSNSHVALSHRRHAGTYKGKEAIIFTNAFNRTQRVNVSVHTSWDGGNSWSAGLVLDSSGSAYSSPTIIGNGDLGVLYERQDKQLTIVFTQVPLKEIL